MKKRELKLTAVGLACVAVTALVWLSSASGEITVAPQEHDFGEVAIGESSTTYFTVTNVCRRYAYPEPDLLILVPSEHGGFSTMTPISVELAQSAPDELVDVNGTLYFAADDGAHGVELWKTDGTAEGTAMVKDLWPGPDRSVIRTSATHLTACGSAVYYRCVLEGSPAELCRSDGTDLGTGLVADINPSGGSNPRELFCLDGTLYFSADDGVNGTELWRSDGTSDGTYMVMNIHADGGSQPTELTSVGGILYFVAGDGVHGREVWKSDGTAAATAMVADISPGLGSSVPSYLTPFQGELFFSAYQSAYGQELWKSDGTEEGTVRVKDILPGNPDPGHWYPNELTVMGDTLFFVTEDGVTGRELWRTDGTEEGTIQVRDINPGEASSSPAYLVNVDGLLLFRASTHPDYGSLNLALWRSDGTEDGTVMVKDMDYSGIGGLAVLGGDLYFQGRAEFGEYELWKSDGTGDGTVLVRDIDPDGSSYPGELTVSNGTLYFVAHDPLYSREVFRSDGSYLGTHVVYDVRPGGDPSIEVDVTFAPTIAGPDGGILHVLGYENSVMAPLQGIGVAPEPTPEELIAEILTTFDATVADGTLFGSGPAASAAGRLGALRNMLAAAQAFIDSGDIEAACTQLLDAYHRTDGEPLPPDFVGGDAAPVLAAMIADLRDLLDCG